MSESDEVEAIIIDITPDELAELAEHGQLMLPYSGGFIGQDPVFSIEVTEY